MVNPGKDVSHNPDDASCDVCGAFAAFSWYTCTDADGVAHWMCGGANVKDKAHTKDRRGRTEPGTNGWTPWKQYVPPRRTQPPLPTKKSPRLAERSRAPTVEQDAQRRRAAADGDEPAAPSERAAARHVRHLRFRRRTERFLLCHRNCARTHVRHVVSRVFRPSFNRSAERPATVTASVRTRPVRVCVSTRSVRA